MPDPYGYPIPGGVSSTIVKGDPGAPGSPGPMGPAGLGFVAPEQFTSDGGNPLFDWGDTIRGVYATNKRLDFTPGRVYYFTGTITAQSGCLVSGSGGSAAGTAAATSTLRALDSTSMLWIRGAGTQVSNIMVDGNNVATTCIKVGGTGSGDVGTSPVLFNVTAQLAAAGGKNFWISGAQNGSAIGCNSINSGGEGWSFTDHFGGWILERCESTGSASWNWHVTDSGNVTLDTCVLERSTNGTQACIRTDGAVWFPSIRLTGCTTSSGGVAVAPTVIASGVTITASTDTVTITGHGLFTGCPIQFSSITGAAGLTAGTTYFLVTKTTNTFQVAATSGGSPINITTDGTATVSTVYRYLIDHQASGTVVLDNCNFGGITGEIAIGMRGGAAPRLQTDGATYYTGAGLIAFLDYDSSAVLDIDGQVLGQVAGLTVGTVPLRTDRSPDTNAGRFRLSAETIYRSATGLLARASLVIGDLFSRFTQSVDGALGWGSGAATQDVTLFRSAAKTMTWQSAGGTTPVVVNVIGDHKVARTVPLAVPITTLVAATTPAIDCSIADHVVFKTAGFNLNKFTVTNGATFQDLRIEVKQGASGGGTFTAPLAADGFLWSGGDANAPALPIGANAYLIVDLTLLDNGFWQEVYRSNPEASSTMFSTALTDAGVKTAAYTATANQIVRADGTSSAFNITLPTAPAVGTRVVAKRVDAVTSNAMNLVAGGSDVFNVAAGSTSLALAHKNASIAVQYIAGAIWVVTSTDAGSGVVYDTRQIVAGTGLLGGGDLTADRTLTPDFGTAAGKVTQGNDSRLSDQRAPTDVPTWAATTAYAKGQLVLSPVGAYAPGAASLVQSIAAFTSGGSFSAANWTHLADIQTVRPPNFDATSGNYVTPCNMTAVTTVALLAGSSGIASWAPVDLIPGRSYDALVGCVVTTAQSGGTTTTTLALYADKNGQPDVASGPVASGTITLTATGNRVAVLGSPYTATAIRYWVGLLYVESGAPTTRATLSVVNTGLTVAHDSGSSIHGAVYRGWSATGLAAMPSTGVTLTGAATPYNVAVRAA